MPSRNAKVVSPADIDANVVRSLHLQDGAVTAGKLSGDALGYTNPKQHGVLMDGSTDDCAALNTLCNSTLASTGGTVIISGPTVINDNLTVPKNIHFWFTKTGSLKVGAGKKVYFYGGIQANRQQIFDLSASGSSLIFCDTSVDPAPRPTNTQIQTFLPEWWGAKAVPPGEDGSDVNKDTNKTAIQAAIDAADSIDAGKVVFANGNYYHNGPLYIHGGRVALEGAGKYQTFLWCVSASTLLEIDATADGAIAGSYIKLKGITFQGFAAGTNGELATRVATRGLYVWTPGPSTGGSQFMHLEDCMFQGFSAEGVYLNSHNQGYMTQEDVQFQYCGTGVRYGTSNEGIASSFKDCRFSDCLEYGFRIERNLTKNGFLTNSQSFFACTFEANGKDGFRACSVQNLALYGCYWEKNGKQARSETPTGATLPRPWADIVLESPYSTDLSPITVPAVASYPNSQPLYNVTIDTPRFSTNNGAYQGNPALRLLFLGDYTVGDVEIRNPYWSAGYIDFGDGLTTPNVRFSGYMTPYRGHVNWMYSKVGGTLQAKGLTLEGAADATFGIAAKNAANGTGHRLSVVAGNATQGQLTGAAALTAGGAGSGAGYAANNTLTGGGGTVKVLTVDGGGGILTYEITSPFSTFQNTVEFSMTGGAGTGAKFTVPATVTDMTNPGTGGLAYSPLDVLTPVAPVTGSIRVDSVSGGLITGYTILTPIGGSYQLGVPFSVTGGTGTLANFRVSSGSVTVYSGGTNYVVGDLLELLQSVNVEEQHLGNGGIVRVEAVDGNGAITAISLVAGGANYTVIPVTGAIGAKGGHGSGATFTIGQVSNAANKAGGDLYLQPGSGTGEAASATTPGAAIVMRVPMPGTVPSTNSGVTRQSMQEVFRADSLGVHIGTTTIPAIFDIIGGNGTGRILGFKTGTGGSGTANTYRWLVEATATSESGSNVGSDFAIFRRDDAGLSLGQPLTITRSTGDVLLENNLTVNGATLTARRVIHNGTAHAASDWDCKDTPGTAAKSWGPNSTVSIISANDSRGVVQVTTSALDTPPANPVLYLTFKNGAWTAAPFANANYETSGTGAAPTGVGVEATTTKLKLTYFGTPPATTAATYRFSYSLRG